MSRSLHFLQKRGKAILELAEDFAGLRIAVFRDFPYLYEGTPAYEMNYIRTYAACRDALVFGVYDGDRMVGATTCLPLIHETENVRKSFIEQGYDIDRIFYFGESILLKEYRGQGLGHRFFDERESFASSFGKYDITTFCAVNRPGNHPLKPSDYVPNDHFWIKRGYEKHEELICQMNWQDINEDHESSKTLTFWLRSI